MPISTLYKKISPFVKPYRKMVIATLLLTFLGSFVVQVIALILKNPPIIFLDEPTASLDAIATEQIKKSLDAIKRNRTVIIISHSIS